MKAEFIVHCVDNNLEGVNDCLSCGVDVNTKEDWLGCQWTALMFACQYGNSAIVSRLLKEPGLDINYQDERGRTAVFLARRHMRCLKILADTGRVIEFN